MILTQTIRKLIYLFALIPNIIIKSHLYCSYICQKNTLFDWNHQENSRKSESFQQITQCAIHLVPAVPSLITIGFSKSPPAVPSRTTILASLLPAGSSPLKQPWRGLWCPANLIAKRLRATFLSPTRGTEGVVKTIERNGYILRPFVKGEGLGVG